MVSFALSKETIFVQVNSFSDRLLIEGVIDRDGVGEELLFLQRHFPTCLSAQERLPLFISLCVVALSLWAIPASGDHQCTQFRHGG